MWHGPRPTFVPSGILIQPCSRLTTTYVGRKLGRGCVPLGEGAGSPSNTMCPGPRPNSMPIFILIHPTVWPQYTTVTDRQVCLSACLHYCTDPDVTWGSGSGCPLVVHYLADLQSVHGLCCYNNIARTRNVSECKCSVLGLWYI